jgi:hypothetical protein
MSLSRCLEGVVGILVQNRLKNEFLDKEYLGPDENFYLIKLKVVCPLIFRKEGWMMCLLPMLLEKKLRSWARFFSWA